MLLYSELDASLVQSRSIWATAGLSLPPKMPHFSALFWNEHDLVNFARRLHENTFLLTRLETVRNRFARPHASGYVNLQKTHAEEMHAVSMRLLQKAWVKDFSAFNLCAIPTFPLTVVRSAHRPLKLIVPHDKASEILDFVFTDVRARRLIGLRLTILRANLQLLRKAYAQQIRDYAAFAGVRATFPVPPGDGLVRAMAHVQDLRRAALDLYQRFRLPFPNQRQVSFYIYLHDPEQRVLRSDIRGMPFESILEATPFYGDVVAAFKRVPKMYYRGVLQEVVLLKDDPWGVKRRSNGEVSIHGREMILVYRADTLFTLDKISTLWVIYIMHLSVAKNKRVGA